MLSVFLIFLFMNYILFNILLGFNKMCFISDYILFKNIMMNYIITYNIASSNNLPSFHNYLISGFLLELYYSTYFGFFQFFDISIDQMV